jgi:hypothetical protein
MFGMMSLISWKSVYENGKAVFILMCTNFEPRLGQKTEKSCDIPLDLIFNLLDC